MRKDTTLRPGADTGHRSPTQTLPAPECEAPGPISANTHEAASKQTRRAAGSSQASLVRLSDVLKAQSLAGLLWGTALGTESLNDHTTHVGSTTEGEVRCTGDAVTDWVHPGGGRSLQGRFREGGGIFGKCDRSSIGRRAALLQRSLSLLLPRDLLQ